MFLSSLSALKSEIGSSPGRGDFCTRSLIIALPPGFALITFSALLTTGASKLICFQATSQVIFNISLKLMT